MKVAWLGLRELIIGTNVYRNIKIKVLFLSVDTCATTVILYINGSLVDI